MALLSRNQAQFAARLAARTGLNPRLVGAWIIAEEPAGANVPVGHNDQNWLNIGNTDTKWYGGASAWKNPVAAADKSAAWLQGKYSVPGFGRAASGIVSFSRTAGQPISQQIAALQRSGWASSGYPDLPGLVGQVSGKLGLRPYMQAERQGMAPAPASSQGGKALTLNTGPQYRTSQQQVFDQAGYERAQRAYALGQFLQNQPRSPFDALTRGGVAKPSNPLLAVLPQTAPSPVDYTDSVTRLQKIAGEKVKIRTPKISGRVPGADLAEGKAILAPGADRSGVETSRQIRDFVGLVAGSIKRPITITTGTNHSQMTTSGNVSDHWSGNAADIGMAANGGGDDSREGDMIAGRALMLAGIPRLQARKMAQQGGLYTLNPTRGPLKGRRVQIIWKTNEGGNHHNHVHIGIE